MNAIVSLNQPLVDRHGLGMNVSRLDFDRLKHKYTASSEAEMSVESWDKAEREYRRFLSLKAFYPAVSLVPSKEVDALWHAHILDTRAYREDCHQVFGRFIDHYPYFGIYGEDDYQQLKDAFAQTVALYEKHFGAYPGGGTESQAMRCQDHACHVPTSCACRVEGACK
ncbi:MULTISPECIES: glycine-rich domain-containing protein-like [unclassified Cobetia]|uniref:glycine-rich domain-containing protein n=1 Tax=unclassified Cobetia TaxID=2609414 RepID=UPI002097A51A|nr:MULTISPECIES: glycine-rich domain-containing protein-like [unclassified Cobetia]MCO7233432.1 glycine-rich domain-containing protein-like [Cobetia sp. Dlab-2-AX]MCO7236707.1 glycine-rich domain-containing protein-like [Cobetia sp. Dlab-2-U]